MAHLNSASFPTIMLSGRMLISYLCVVTEIKKNLHFVFYIDRDEKLSYSLTLLYPVHIKIPTVTKTQWGGSQIIGFRINPWINTDKVGHKAWYGAFKEGVVAHNNALTQDVNLVPLTWNWNIIGKWLLAKINISLMLFTLNRIPTTIFTQKTRTKAVGLGVNPRLHRHKIRYKTGNWAFENCIVASDNALRRYIDFISLVRNWKKK